MTRAGHMFALAGAAAIGACTLMSSAPPLDVRYFSPEPVRATEANSEARAASAAKLQLGQLTSSANLRDRIVHRESPVEIGVYETLRWTETPDAYVRRALARALFQQRRGPFEQVLGGGTAPVLDVEIVAFEVLRQDKGWAGRVELRYRLRDERVVIANGVVAALQPAAGAGFDGAVTAVGQAMDTAATRLAAEVASRLPPP